MFIFTAKFDKNKVIVAALVLFVIIAAVVILSSGSKEEVITTSATVKSNTERVDFLKSFGWEVSDDPIEEQSVIIPKTFSDVYSDYNELQTSQGFDLTEYAGLEATRYTYEVLNYPNADSKVVADIIVYRNKVIAGDIQSVSLSGFMTGLKYPE